MRIGQYEAASLWLEELRQSGHLLLELGGEGCDVPDSGLVGKRLREIGPLLVKTHGPLLLTLVYNIPVIKGGKISIVIT